MSTQRYQASFRATNVSLGSATNLLATNVADNFAPTNPGWTSGVALIDALQLIAPMNQHWTLQQLSITAELAIVISVAGGPLYGKLGKVLAGLAVATTPTNGGGFIPASVYGQKPPADRSAIGVLWDPASDELPPVLGPNAGNTGITTLPVSCSISPPQPIPINVGEEMGCGIWMLPSLVGTVSASENAQLYVTRGTYSIVYDDGVSG